MYRSYKCRKAHQLGYSLHEAELRLLYYVWSSTSGCAWCDFMESGTCYSSGTFLIIGFSLVHEHGLLELNKEDQRSVRLTQVGRDLILKLG
mgnify:CR=1 FL=1